MAKDYNLVSHMGITDQDYVELEGLPQEIANTADIHFWMTYHTYIQNKELETPEETQRLLEEHLSNMQIMVSQRHWEEMTVSANLNLGDGDYETDWYLDSDYLFRCCKECYESNPPTK